MIYKAAAYCRVSTDSDDQANSLASQEKYFREYINRSRELELVQIYVDTGITGTSTKKRTAFNQMIAEAMTGKFDFILTKEISRFARNTLDSIFYTRKLKEHGIGVIFMNDNINTLDPDAELRLTIMSSIAQEESRKTSERVKWGQKRRMEQGVVFGRDLLGYDVRNGKLYINEEGAKIVRLIFHKFVREGKGSHVIARELQEEGIRTSTYMKQWSNTVILRILRNEKMAGDLIQKKTFTPSYLTHEKKYNKGEEEFVIIRNHHEPIISRELFECAQQELARRSPSAVQKSKYSGRYCFSGKIKCAVCGSTYVARTRNRGSGKLYRGWRCARAASDGLKHINKDGEERGCSSPSVNEAALKYLLENIMMVLLPDTSAIIYKMETLVMDILETKGEAEDTVCRKDKIEILNRKIQRLLELYMSEDIGEPEFRQLKEKYEKKLECLNGAQNHKNTNNGIKEAGSMEKEEIHRYISGIVSGKIWDDTFYRNLIEYIRVEENNSILVALKQLPLEWKAVTD